MHNNSTFLKSLSLAQEMQQQPWRIVPSSEMLPALFCKAPASSQPRILCALESAPLGGLVTVLPDSYTYKEACWLQSIG